jgi:hypothetical protein
VLGLLAENSLALGVILLVALLPRRPGAEPSPALRRADPGHRYLTTPQRQL